VKTLQIDVGAPESTAGASTYAPGPMDEMRAILRLLLDQYLQTPTPSTLKTLRGGIKAHQVAVKTRMGMPPRQLKH
jgi:hypothetical protein